MNANTNNGAENMTNPLIQAELSDMVDHWAPEVAKRGGATIIRYSWERPAKASGCAARG